MTDNSTPRYASESEDDVPSDGMGFFRGLVVSGIVSAVFWLTIYAAFLR